ncbi:diguanylate cyclase [Catenovulum sp. 2E275]|uniref:sensor domain-containing diguanylate cyclase n=1 Tax=Catenovulum sp. 2E275 TaxID=2980497 RepID=UPI0021D378C1|nr:sensor domain-containing diguanylate cyclase [Catenovulum sp. 2E275]MCU4675032.1 diguanylate cyclase [Catenovulum sp. 2E275]
MNNTKLINRVCSNQKLRFVISITLLTLVGFISTSLVSYLVAHQTVSKQITHSALPLTSDNIYSEIQRDLMRPIFISSLMAHDTFVRDWTISGEQDQSSLVRYLAEIQQKYQTVTAFYVSDNTLNYYHSSGVLRTVEKGPAINEWYYRVKAMPDEYEINIDHDTANPTRLSVFVNYKTFDYEGNFIGATGVGLALDKVQRLIETYQQKFNRVVYFVNNEGETTLRTSDFSGNPQTLLQQDFKDLIHQYAQVKHKSFQYQSGPHTVYVNARYIPEFNWYVVIEQTDDEQTQKLFNSLILNVVVSIIISILVLTASYFTIATYQKRLEHMATTDRLSGALNRHSFDILLAQNIRLAERKSYTFSGILLDLDFFKNVNDKHGHLIGDQVIKQAVDLIKTQLRESDVLCRWGGEEFLILLPECNLAAAAKIAEQIRLNIGSYEFSHHETLTASFGVAEFKLSQHNEKPDTPESWIHRVDLALYEAKGSGRNKVVCQS